jgi:short-subunit dehydrogenase
MLNVEVGDILSKTKYTVAFFEDDSVEAVRLKIAKAIDTNKSEVYVPAFWWAVMAVIKAIPHALFKRKSF